LARSPIPYVNLTPVLASQMAFSLELALPVDAVGQPMTLYFDLFNNGDGLRSQGWFNNVMVVPDPGTWMLLVLGGAALWLWRRFSTALTPIRNDQGPMNNEQ